jgi:hypothetical protein
MQAFHSIRAVIDRIARQLAGSSRQIGFHLRRMRALGTLRSPPSEDCVIRAAQIARDGDRVSRRTLWWRASLGA